MSFVAKLARATEQSYLTAPSIKSPGVNRARMDPTHFYKVTTDPHIERGVSVGMRLLGAPGAVPYRVIGKSTNGKGVVSTPKIPNNHMLSEHTGRGYLEDMPDPIAHTLASEWLMNIRDRHDENYLVSPKGAHSIDYGHSWLHTMGNKVGSEETPDVRDSDLYKATYDAHLPNHVVNRFLAAAPHIQRVMTDAMTKEGTYDPKSIEQSNQAFANRINHLKALQQHFKGQPIPLKYLSPTGELMLRGESK